MAKSKCCDYCHNVVITRYRIQYDDSKQWHLVCPHCWYQLAPNNPNYRYGGTWKAKR